MQYIDLKDKLRDYVVFSLQDIKKLDSGFYNSRLNDWQKKGYLKKIRRGYYIFSDQIINEEVLWQVANKIYSPSYVSLEMALSYYHLIPESVYGITSVTSNKTQNFKTEIGEFLYRHFRPELMFGYEIISLGGVSCKMAEMEKAILDFFYINTHIQAEADFFELRINEEEFKTRLDYNKLIKYLSLFNNRNLDKRIKNFLKYLKYVNA